MGKLPGKAVCEISAEQCLECPSYCSDWCVCSVHWLDSAQWQVLTLGKNLCICPRGEGGNRHPGSPPPLCAAVHSVRYHFVHSAAPLSTGLALLYRAVRWYMCTVCSEHLCAAQIVHSEHLCVAAHYGDSDHFPVGTLHPLFKLGQFLHSELLSHRTAA